MTCTNLFMWCVYLNNGVTGKVVHLYIVMPMCNVLTALVRIHVRVDYMTYVYRPLHVLSSKTLLSYC
jgi:hypothetical protein